MISALECKGLMDEYFKRHPEVKQVMKLIQQEQQLFIPNYKMWNNVREKHKYHALNYNEQTMNTKTQDTAATKPIRSMYISVEEYSRVVDGLGTQLQLQSRMSDHLGDQLTLSREQINNQSEYIQQLKKERVEVDAQWNKAFAILSQANKDLVAKLAAKHKRSSSKK